MIKLFKKKLLPNTYDTYDCVLLRTPDGSR